MIGLLFGLVVGVAVGFFGHDKIKELIDKYLVM